MTAFSPREIVSELDRHIIGQRDAKRAVAIALRNRWRRQQLEGDMREEVLPKNILMIGPTGVGKTEISRRLAKLAGAPFIKVEATKFTEVGYVGRDVEQIIRDLLEISLHMTRERLRRQVEAKAELQAEERVIDALVGEAASADTRGKFRRMLRAGELNDREIELNVKESASASLPTCWAIARGRSSPSSRRAGAFWPSSAARLSTPTAWSTPTRVAGTWPGFRSATTRRCSTAPPRACMCRAPYSRS